jgi:hypothetical protein
MGDGIQPGLYESPGGVNCVAGSHFFLSVAAEDSTYGRHSSRQYTPPGDS